MANDTVESPLAGFDEILPQIAIALCEAQTALDEKYKEGLKAPENIPATRYVIPKMMVEYKAVIAFTREKATKKKKLIVFGPTKVKSEKHDVQTMSTIRFEILAIPPETEGK